MPSAIDFYFDFSSPYGYLASEKIEALAAKHGRGVNWKPCSSALSSNRPARPR